MDEVKTSNMHDGLHLITLHQFHARDTDGALSCQHNVRATYAGNGVSNELEGKLSAWLRLSRTLHHIPIRCDLVGS